MKAKETAWIAEGGETPWRAGKKFPNSSLANIPENFLPPAAKRSKAQRSAESRESNQSYVTLLEKKETKEMSTRSFVRKASQSGIN